MSIPCLSNGSGAQPRHHRRPLGGDASTPTAEVACYTALPKCLLNDSSARRAPSSVSSTDFAFDFGFEMRPREYRRANESQSKPFQALAVVDTFRYSNARTISSSLAASYSIVTPSVRITLPLSGRGEQRERRSAAVGS